MTEAGNPNNITLDYSNAIYPTTEDPDNPNKPKDPEIDYIKDVVNVFTFGIDVLKLDGEATTPNTPLEGVTFDLYRVNDGKAPATGEKVTETWLKTAGNAVKIGSKRLVQTVNCPLRVSITQPTIWLRHKQRLVITC